ncbi:5-methyltetrahydropteroyltriglutamate--homocysteine S-methyltransferase [Metabacillus mangrovi]|uniref:5-methyltetrahydropteroyltriglutamate-- homocysteine S-methyltransferase n=1 Tax=Metabacillus mangrovi TaxID=1491830 RepID=UPI0012BAFE6A|nr:5-methyltetrahydropteroyltriglutamate--homocysteine S-methyltransferase [Metabacillus mangrovi]
MAIYSSNQGYPRMGQDREWKRTLEQFWKKEMSEEEFSARMKKLKSIHVKKQADAGIHIVPAGDFTYYDQMLDTAFMFNLIPERHKSDHPLSLGSYFSMARGSDDAHACAMKKWFDTNYHYVVPEWEEDYEPRLNFNKPLEDYLEAKEAAECKPVIIGPYTFIILSKGCHSLKEAADKLLPLYIQCFRELKEHGAELVQVDEPAFVYEGLEEDLHVIFSIYEAFAEAVPDLKLLIQTYFEAPEAYEKLTALPVSGWGLDFTKGNTIELLKTHGFPKDKILAAGIVDGRNIWRTNGAAALDLLYFLIHEVQPADLHIQPSCSLIHVPETAEGEDGLPEGLLENLAFAQEKLEEVVTLVNAENADAREKILQWSTSSQPEAGPSSKSLRRAQSFSERTRLQQRVFRLPELPLTTIGSLPQTKEVRRNRKSFKDGTITKDQYERFIQEETKRWINIQEELGMDVLVHGEFERNDMVEYFGENLDGFAFTRKGWVQSYGSRGVKPPVIYDDVQWRGPITRDLTLYAQSLTEKPVKGMLTGPVTILNWSFAREDRFSESIAWSIAQALRKEVHALEEAGIRMIQIDEPAFREGLPLKASKQESYSRWAVNAFRASHYDVKAETQIHTHMCYSEFSEMLPVISEMDADVLSIEASKGGGELIRTFKDFQYDKSIGLGVYDIHSPRIPSVKEMEAVIRHCLEVLPAERFWINPDCGLKTRSEAEAVKSMENMAKAARIVRESLKQTV